MATIDRLVETNELKTTVWKEQIANPRVRPYFLYNDLVDALTLLVVDPIRPKITHYIDDYVALLYDPDSLEIIGVRVEAFERGFLPSYVGLQKVWRLCDKDAALKDFGDLTIFVQRMEPLITTEISRITHTIAEKRGLELPVLA